MPKMKTWNVTVQRLFVLVLREAGTPDIGCSLGLRAHRAWAPRACVSHPWAPWGRVPGAM